MSRTPIKDFELASCPIETLILSTNLYRRKKHMLASHEYQTSVAKYFFWSFQSQPHVNLLFFFLSLLKDANLIICWIQVTNQSNNREYIVFAKPSRLIVALWGSRLLLITSSGVIMTRLHNASSNAAVSHLRWCRYRKLSELEWKTI